jgi:hypothetical protein
MYLKQPRESNYIKKKRKRKTGMNNGGEWGEWG